MIRTLLISLLLTAGHASASEQVISVQHDSQRGVTCWIVNNTGISCLPDRSLPQVNVKPSHIKNEPMPAASPAPLPHVERFQL
ncbi:hypothetical protein PspR84_04080 [Pseudomonas sp. R84]|nr:hypothetical protein PspR84_04080 [Pseudomonas sp. R84]